MSAPILNSELDVTVWSLHFLSPLVQSPMSRSGPYEEEEKSLVLAGNRTTSYPVHSVWLFPGHTHKTFVYLFIGHAVPHWLKAISYMPEGRGLETH
jgi:hypothetical protein